MKKIMELLSDGRSRTSKEIAVETGYSIDVVRNYLCDLYQMKRVSSTWALNEKGEKTHCTYKAI